MDYVTLNNGVKMPMLGFGVYRVSKENCEAAVLEAIRSGYRLIDTAQSYFNEEQVGSAIRSCGVPRAELFITTKVWIDHYGYEKTRRSVEESMHKLGVEYLDLVLLHQAFSDTFGAYRALEDLYREGKRRAIGVSNFLPDRLADFCAFSDILPQIDQVEVNPLYQQTAAQAYMGKRGMQMEAWAPFGEGRNGIFTNPVLLDIASQYGKSPAQVILRWLIQRGIVVLAKSIHAERIRENLNIFDFSLTDADMTRITALDTGKSVFFDFATPDTVDMFVHFVKARRDQK